MKQKFVSMPYLVHFWKNLGIFTNYEPYITQLLWLLFSNKRFQAGCLLHHSQQRNIGTYMIYLNRLENRREFTNQPFNYANSFHNSESEFYDTHRFPYNLAINSNYSVQSRNCCILGCKAVFIIIFCIKSFDNCLKLFQQGDSYFL